VLSWRLFPLEGRALGVSSVVPRGTRRLSENPEGLPGKMRPARPREGSRPAVSSARHASPKAAGGEPSQTPKGREDEAGRTYVPFIVELH